MESIVGEIYCSVCIGSQVYGDCSLLLTSVREFLVLMHASPPPPPGLHFAIKLMCYCSHDGQCISQPALLCRAEEQNAYVSCERDYDLSPVRRRPAGARVCDPLEASVVVYVVCPSDHPCAPLVAQLMCSAALATCLAPDSSAEQPPPQMLKAADQAEAQGVPCQPGIV